MLDLKEFFFTIKMGCFRPTPQYSGIPEFHTDGINRFLLKNYYLQEVIEVPKHIIFLMECIS